MSPRLQPRFALHPLTAAGLLALAAFGAPALAQEAAKTDADQTLDRVEVTGTRASLQQSLALKRNSAVRAGQHQRDRAGPLPRQ
jgi:iron complex outermembrane receptor protein